MSRPFFIITPTVILAVAGLASASTVDRSGLAPLPTNLSARCAPLAQVPASATIIEPRISAQVSVANCMAEEAMNQLSLAPTSASIAQLDAAVEPSVALFDNVINTVDDPYWKIVANDAKRDLYVGMIVRQRNSIRGPNMAARNALEPKLAAWQNKAASANAAVADAVRAHPDVASRDPVIASISARATTQPVPAVATRESQCPNRCEQ